jgi:hypothetical protein
MIEGMSAIGTKRHRRPTPVVRQFSLAAQS